MKTEFITLIETTQSPDSMGNDCTQDDIENWCAYLEEKLVERFLDAEVIVKQGSHNELYVEDESRKNYVREFMDCLWEGFN